MTDEQKPKRSNWKAKLRRHFRNGQQVLRPTSANVVSILTNDERWQGVLAFDLFGETIVAVSPPPWDDTDTPAGGALAGDWSDSDDARVRTWLSREWDLDVAIETVREAVDIVARKHTIHPVVDTLNSFSWDGTLRLDSWLTTYLGAEDSPYTRAAGRIFLISAVARAYCPGCKVDTVPILEGAQGAGKSTALRELTGGPFFLETGVELGSKDSFQQLRRKWIVELAELDALSKADTARIKAFISAQVDTYRASYGHRTGDRPRQCIFVGTTNARAYLKDETGARRFLPIQCGKIDVAGIKRDRAQLWAEARVCFERGEAWHVENVELLREFQMEQEARYEAHPWEQTIAEWINDPAHPKRRRDGVTTNDVLSGALGMDAARPQRPDEMRVGAILRRLGWEPPKSPVMRKGAKVRPYRPTAAREVVQVGQEVVHRKDEGSSTFTQPKQPKQPISNKSI